jgi:glycosyltransferase involved in cell wall biosynthesis
MEDFLSLRRIGDAGCIVPDQISETGDGVKVAILWTKLSGYLNTCMKELAHRDGMELFVCHSAPVKAAPFDDQQFQWISNRLIWRSAPNARSLQDRVTSFSPDVLIFAGWHIRAYRQIAKELRDRCFRIMTMDNCWAGTMKQWMGVVSAPYFVRPLADSVWVPGERQAAFARRMGFKEQSILRGNLSCDLHSMEAPYLARIGTRQPVPRRFIFVGRFAAEKGVETLVRAYQLYRKTHSDPWPLICCGAGPLESVFNGISGIQVEGFIQPHELPSKLANAGCLVLPSMFEQWALVVHEAASAGLLILTSANVGAAVHLVQPGYNGFIASPGDEGELAALMSRITVMSDALLDRMSRASHCLSYQFSPERWANTILDSFHAWVEEIRITKRMSSPGKTVSKL